MSKKYLITKVIAGEKQGFLKNVTKDGGSGLMTIMKLLHF